MKIPPRQFAGTLSECGWGRRRRCAADTQHTVRPSVRWKRPPNIPSNINFTAFTTCLWHLWQFLLHLQKLPPWHFSIQISVVLILVQILYLIIILLNILFFSFECCDLHSLDKCGQYIHTYLLVQLRCSNLMQRERWGWVMVTPEWGKLSSCKLSSFSMPELVHSSFCQVTKQAKVKSFFYFF